jgi:hypothetical protein
MSGQAVERHTASASPALVSDSAFRQLMRQAEVWSRSKLVPKALQGKPDDVLLVGMYGFELGVPFTKALSQVHVIEGAPRASSQLRVAIAEREGHEVWTEESSSERATVCGLRRGAPAERVQKVTWTLADARRAGLLAVWVEKKIQAQGDQYARLHKYVVGAMDDGGKPVIDPELVEKAPQWARPLIDSGVFKVKDNWQKYPADMLWSRAAGSLCVKAFGDALMGLTALPDHIEDQVAVEAEVMDDRHRPPSPDPDDEEPAEAELVEDETPNQGEGAEGAAVEGDAGADSQGSTTGDGADSHDVGDTAPEPTPAREGGEPSAGNNDPGRPAEAAPPNPYAKAVHVAAHEAGLADEALDEILHDVCGDVSATAVNRNNAHTVLERIRAAGGAS